MSNDKVDEGFASLKRNYGSYRNPYDVVSVEYSDFERGWSQALKRCTESELKKLEKTGFEIDCEKAAVERKKIELSKAAYAAAKGS